MKNPKKPLEDISKTKEKYSVRYKKPVTEEKEYKCQSCFQNNSVSIEMTFCSETVDVIEDCTVCCNPNSISYTIENEKVIYFEVVKTY